jgi:hypothetical protein
MPICYLLFAICYLSLPRSGGGSARFYYENPQSGIGPL